MYGTTKLMFFMGIIMYNHVVTIYRIPNDTRTIPAKMRITHTCWMCGKER